MSGTYSRCIQILQEGEVWSSPAQDDDDEEGREEGREGAGGWAERSQIKETPAPPEEAAFHSASHTQGNHGRSYAGLRRALLE